MDLDITWIGLLIRIGIILLGLAIAFIVIRLRQGKRKFVARLTVEDSEIPSLIHKEFLIQDYPARIGRSRENEVPLHPDESVSRFHARLECEEGRLFLKEVLIRDNDGKIHGPTNGTFVDGRRLDPAMPAVEIFSGSKIRLGSRLTLRFDEVMVPAGGYRGTRRDIQVPPDVLEGRKEP
jgi:pSer/pThr/pTyr-binding forkhead associated (FHA) protein